ncbi:MAG: hypoxanthine phosphoribosyltransferase, partial [Desulfobacterales bacterium]
MPELISILTKEEICRKVASVAEKISQDYQNRELFLIGVLKGSFIFLADLIRQLTIPVEIDFVGTSSYGSGSSSSGNICLTKEISSDIRGKDVIVIEDIIDTGITLKYLIDYLNSFEPRSVSICAFIDKTERRETDIHIDYCCHKVEQGFLVGY